MESPFVQSLHWLCVAESAFFSYWNEVGGIIPANEPFVQCTILTVRSLRQERGSVSVQGTVSSVSFLTIRTEAKQIHAKLYHLVAACFGHLPGQIG